MNPPHKIRLPVTDMCLPLDDFRMLADNEVVRYYPTPILLIVTFTTFFPPAIRSFRYRSPMCWLSRHMCW